MVTNRTSFLGKDCSSTATIGCHHSEKKKEHIECVLKNFGTIYELTNSERTVIGNEFVLSGPHSKLGTYSKGVIYVLNPTSQGKFIKKNRPST